MKKQNIVRLILCLVGLILYSIFLNLEYNISKEAWLCAIGSNIGVILYCFSIYFNKDKRGDK